MKHLINRIYLSPLDNISSHFHKVVVARNLDVAFIDYHEDHINQVVEEDNPRTIYYTQAIDDFIENRFVTMLAGWVTKDYPVRLYVDDETYVRLYARYLKTLFPNLGWAQFKHLLTIDFLDRLCTDVSLRTDSLYYQDNFLRFAFDKSDFDPHLAKILRDHSAGLSMEFRTCLDQHTASLATTIRQWAKECLDDIVVPRQQQLYRTFLLDDVQERLHVVVDDDPHPLSGIQGLEILHLIKQPSSSPLIAEDPAQGISALVRDLNILTQQDNDWLEVGYWTLIFEGSDRAVIDAFLNRLKRGYRYDHLIPRSMISRISPALLCHLLSHREVADYRDVLTEPSV